MKTQTDLSIEQLVVQFDYNELDQGTRLAFAAYFTTEEEFLSLKELFSGIQQLDHLGPDPAVKQRLDNLFVETHQQQTSRLRALYFNWKLVAAVLCLAVLSLVFWQSYSGRASKHTRLKTNQLAKQHPRKNTHQVPQQDQHQERQDLPDQVNDHHVRREPIPVQLATHEPDPVSTQLKLADAPVYSMMRSAEAITVQGSINTEADQSILPQDGIYNATEGLNYSQKATDSLLLLIVPND